ncbi:MAG: LemA family protein [Fusobacteriaceae bacterium]|jgi:LemA protein|nr:LemA family protein [Fusobacteriaceae bacterium]
MIVLGVILGIIVLLGLFFMGKYNGFIKLHQKVKNAWSQIDVQLQKRLDLIPNLVEVVKGYAKHEKETFEDVVKARNTYINASSVEDKIAAEGELGAIMSKLMMLTENYPELKANTNFLDLQGQLKEIEDKIGFARQFYNDTTSDYNEAIRLFPGNVIAGIFNFKEEPLFRTVETARTAPQIKF